MFEKRKKKGDTRKMDDLQVSIIHSSTNTIGTIDCQASIRFDGKLSGEINAVNKIVIGEKAIINGDLSADIIEIFGIVNGDCHAKSSLTLLSSANFKGKIFTKQIIVHEGAVFNGGVEMSIKNKGEHIEKMNTRIINESNKLLQKIVVVLSIISIFFINAIFQVAAISGSKSEVYSENMVGNQKADFDPIFHHVKFTPVEYKYSGILPVQSFCPGS